MQLREYLAVPGVIISFSVFNFSAGLAALRVIDSVFGLRSPTIGGTIELAALAVLGYIGYQFFRRQVVPKIGPSSFVEN
jgi:hypothetical protein